MNRIVLPLLIVIVISASGLYGQKAAQVKSEPKLSKVDQKKISAEALMSVKRIGDPQLSPDGKKLLFSISIPNIKENKFSKDLYVASLDGSSPKKITRNAGADYNARWSPDGKKIAYISVQKKSSQVYVMDYPDGEPTQITNMPNGVDNLLWSPDGTRLSYTSDVKIDKTLKELYPDYPKADMRIYSSLPIRHWSEWTDENFSHLFILDANGGEPKDLMPGEKYETPLKPFGGVEEIGWAPDGKEIAYTSKKVNDFVWSTDSDIYLVCLATGKTKNITEGMDGFDKSPLYSPDGKWIAFASQERAGFESDKIRLMLYDRKTGEITELTKTLDQWSYEFAWAPDSKTIFFTGGDKAAIQIYSVSIDGDWNKLTTGEYRYGSGLCAAPDGRTLIAGRQDFQRPLEFYSIPASGGPAKQITHTNDFHFIRLKKIKVTQRWIESGDGEKVHCWTLFPPDFDPNKKYPMITYCQGGPQATITPRFHYRWNLYLMASQGYIVLAPNRRGLPGFGQEWNDAISQDWGGKPMMDILSATDALSKEPYVDKEGLCAVGASAGGYAAFWLAGNHEKRFKAFVSHSGVFNFESMYGSTEELWFPDWEYGGPYWDPKNSEQYEKHSPHRYAQNWDTPILISAGEHDYRVPYTQSLEAFTAAQSLGLPSKLIFFPKETHFIAHPQEFIVWSAEFFKFLDKYAKR